MKHFGWKPWSLCLLGVVFALTGCSKVSQTEKAILDWGNALNLHLSTGGVESNYSYPVKLADIDPGLTLGLSDVDAWGNKLFYRLLRDDRYNLISAGADGQFGNDDDIVMENGLLYEASKVYSAYPLRK